MNFTGIHINQFSLLRLRIKTRKNLLRLRKNKKVRESLLIILSALIFTIIIFLTIYATTHFYIEYYYPQPTAFKKIINPTAFNDYLIT